MKKLKNLVITFLCLIILPMTVNAASGTVSVSGTNTVVVGNKVTYTVTISSSTAIGSWEMQLEYDKNYLQLTSTTSESNGVRMANSSATGVKSKKYTFTFKALKTGSTKVTVPMYDAYAFGDMSELSLTSSGKTLKIITQEELEASFSKDNDLKELKVEGYEISPAFTKDNLNYTLTVPEGTETVNIIATPNDSKSSVSGGGVVNVTEGTNNVSIVVRAENGSEKTYTLAIDVIDANPINVSVDGENYTVVKLRNNFACEELFTEGEVNINETPIPTCVNEKANITLVGLKNPSGEIGRFIYNNGKYEKYNEVTGTSLKIVILDYDGNLPGLVKEKASIDGKSYDVFKYKNNEKSYVVYGLNIATGEKDFYLYDTVNKTFSLYNAEQIKNLVETNKIYLYIIIAFGISLVLAIFGLMKSKKEKKKPNKENILEKNDNIKKEEKKRIKEEKIKNRKENKKEIKEEKKEVKEDVNEIKDLTEDDTDTYYLFESDRKKSKKRKK